MFPLTRNVKHILLEYLDPNIFILKNEAQLSSSLSSSPSSFTQVLKQVINNCRRLLLIGFMTNYECEWINSRFSITIYITRYSELNRSRTQWYSLYLECLIYRVHAELWAWIVTHRFLKELNIKRTKLEIVKS